MFNAIISKGHSMYKKGAERVLPPLSQSQFKEKGVLTAEEFLLAGDHLVNTCPTWKWEAGDASKMCRLLPPGKQYLITRNVPCMRRAAAVEDYGNCLPTDDAADVDAEGGEWVEADAAAAGDAAGINDDGFEELPQVSRAQARVVDIDEEEQDVGGATEDIPDISDLDLNAPCDDAAAALAPPSAADASSDVLLTRTYDLLITYDLYYHVPRFWLIGYADSGAPLTQAEVFEDVVSDYTHPSHRDRKTVSVEEHPHRAGGGVVVSIHPCRHAAVMKRLGGVVAGEGAEFRVEHYLVLFLKFIASVVPTIEYDYTMSAGGL